MKKLRRVSENEVIAEFLKNEYFRQEYHCDREKYESIVMNPDLSNSVESAARRRLLYRRCAHWRELPLDTQWWILELDSPDIPNLRVLPRGHWSKMSKSKSPSLGHIVKSIQQKRFPNSTAFDVAMIQAICYRLRGERSVSSVMLIGLDENHALTILEGNHRLIALLLGQESLLQSHFKIYAGLSPKMRDYWLYENTFKNLCRHALNRVRADLGQDTALPLEASRALSARIGDKASD